jgi:hypothetical protein
VFHFGRATTSLEGPKLVRGRVKINCGLIDVVYSRFRVARVLFPKLYGEFDMNFLQCTLVLFSILRFLNRKTMATENI